MDLHNKTVDQYLATVPDAERAELERLRAFVRNLVPEAIESISYGMPAYKYKNKPLFYFAAFKDHLSVFATPGPNELLKDKLAAYKTSKGTIQFTLDHPLSDDLLTDILALRKAEIEATH